MSAPTRPDPTLPASGDEPTGDEPTGDPDGPPIGPVGASTLAEVIGHAERNGFGVEFRADLGDGVPVLVCPVCGERAMPAAVRIAWMARLEGASDPAEMALVSALCCPQCGTGGVYVARYGPEAGDADAAVLPLLPDLPAP